MQTASLPTGTASLPTGTAGLKMPCACLPVSEFHSCHPATLPCPHPSPAPALPLPCPCPALQMVFRAVCNVAAGKLHRTAPHPSAPQHTATQCTPVRLPEMDAYRGAGALLCQPACLLMQAVCVRTCAGAELCISYVPVNMARDERRILLHNHFNFW